MSTPPEMKPPPKMPPPPPRMPLPQTPPPQRFELIPTNQPLSTRDFVVLGVFTGGLIFYVWAPIWFVPPHYDLTAAVYVAIVFAWFPLSMLLKRTRTLCSMIVIGLFFSSCWCAMAARRSPVYNFMIFSGVSCTEISNEDGDVHYRCEASSMEATTDFDFYSKDGLPIMWRTY